MTIIAGFPGKDYVVLAADSDEGGLYVKSSVRKIVTIERAGCACVIGGAGHGDFIDLAVQEVKRELQPPYNVDAICELLEEIVTEIYSERIDALPPHEQADADFELLCGVYAPESLPTLVRVRRAMHLVRDTPTTIGKGSDLARYLINTLGKLQTMDLPAAIRLAVYLIAQAKRHVGDCGGDTQVVVLMNNGTRIEMPPEFIFQQEQSAAILLQEFTRFMFHQTDPHRHGFNADRIGAAIEYGGKRLTAALLELLPKQPAVKQSEPPSPDQEAPQVPQSPTGDPQVPPPSPE